MLSIFLLAQRSTTQIWYLLVNIGKNIKKDDGGKGKTKKQNKNVEDTHLL